MSNKDEHAITLVREAIGQARAKHGESIEGGSVTDDRRFRILGEEVGEVARAIEDLEVAYARAWGTSDRSQENMSKLLTDVSLAREHLRAELAQVASTAVRWLTVGNEFE